ncbi:glycosyltransferase [Candidatus Thioglobus sp.]|nr:glycosyltransferase [Candidatus Thioglobus sp.]
MKKVYILIPSLRDDGAIKGAVAIANGLSKYFDVAIVVLKKITKYTVFINPKVQVIALSPSFFWLKKYVEYKKILNSGPNNEKHVSISMCFSADLINLMSSSEAKIIASVRANIPKTYFSTYGWFGKILAKNHFYILKKFKHVLSMSKSMSQQLYNSGIGGLVEIGNFIDEENLNKERIPRKNLQQNHLRIVFVGSFIERKRIDLLIDAVDKLSRNNIQLHLDLVGDGPLRESLHDIVNKLDLRNQIKFHGHRGNPYSILQEADFFVLPSIAEGVSRASLEALYFGVPCILRDIDANKELITPGINGYLFKTDQEFFHILEKITTSENKSFERKSLLPEFFQHKTSIGKLVKLINTI